MENGIALTRQSRFPSIMVALLVGTVQAEKFCDGAFLGLLKQGCIIRWLGKLEVIDNRKK